MTQILSRFKELPILGILRDIKEEHLPSLADSILTSGLKSVEITMNTPHAATLIRKMIYLSNDNLLIGAGTVLNKQDMFDALEAGACFIVTPVVNKDVIEYCQSNTIPIFPGALTPTEIYAAWSLGASMVKVFPASLFGPSYIKEIKAPLNRIELMPVGGITSKNIAEYFKMGASAAAFGASIFRKEYIKSDRFDLITEEIKKLISAYKNPATLTFNA